MNKITKLIAALIFSAFLLVSCGASDESLKEKYGAISMGMSKEELIKNLGDPDEETEQMTGNTLTWKNGDGVTRIEVKVALDKVIYYNWND